MRKSPTGYVHVTALPAAYGDALWVEYGRGRDTYRLLIDGGPASTYAAVRAWLERLNPAEHRIELFVVTHIDADHIDGAILLLQEFRALGLRFRARISGSTAGGICRRTHLGMMCSPPSRVSSLAPSLRVVGCPGMPPSGPRPSSCPNGTPAQPPLPGGASLTLLSPQQRRLRRLRRHWDTVARDAGWSPGDTEGARDRLSRRQDYVPAARVDVCGGEAYQPDNSVANGSSIAFAFEYEDVMCLFTGDAVTDCLANGLERLAAERGTGPVHFDLVKLPHHGSARNVDKRLAELMTADRFLISTNGANVTITLMPRRSSWS